MKKLIFFVVFVAWAGMAQAQEKVKPNIPYDKILNAQEKVQVKEYLKDKILKDLVPVKNDYVDKDNRGTVAFDTKKGVNMLGEDVLEQSNYAFHKTIIPDGTTIKGINFAQKKPHTQAISGKNLTFIDCNLTNVERDPSWTLIDSINRHMTFETKIEGEKTYEIQYVEKDGTMVENQRTDITPIVATEHP